MSAPNIYGGSAHNLLLKNLNMRGNIVTLAGTYVLGVNDDVVQVLDPGGSGRTVTLPPEADSTNLLFIIVNDASGVTETLTVEDDAAGLVMTLVSGATPAINEVGIVHCDGITWRALLVALRGHGA